MIEKPVRRARGLLDDRDIGCARPTGVDMVAPPEVPRKAEGRKAKAARGMGSQKARPETV
jgi:hypothetical protein